MKKILLMAATLGLCGVAQGKIFEEYLYDTDYQYLDYSASCNGISQDKLEQISNQCFEEVAEPIEDISPIVAKKKLEQYSQCYVRNGISKSKQQHCIASAKNGDEDKQTIAAISGAFQQLANSRGTSQITLPLPPQSQLINHMFPEDIGGQLGNMKVSLASAVFQSDMTTQEIAAWYREKVGNFLEYRHSNGDISFIKGAGKEVKQPTALLKALMEKPNIQITKKVNMMTGKQVKGSQVTLFYKR